MLIVLHFASDLTLTEGGYFTKVLVVSQEDGQPAKAHKHEEGWPKFKCAMLEIHCCALPLTLVRRTHYSARVEKGQHKKLLGRMDIVPATKLAAHDEPKQASMPVNGVDNVACRFVAAPCTHSGSHSPPAYLCFQNSFTSA